MCVCITGVYNCNIYAYVYGRLWQRKEAGAYCLPHGRDLNYLIYVHMAESGLPLKMSGRELTFN